MKRLWLCECERLSINNVKNEILYWVYYENSCCNIYYVIKRKREVEY